MIWSLILYERLRFLNPSLESFYVIHHIERLKIFLEKKKKKKNIKWNEGGLVKKERCSPPRVVQPLD